MFQYSTAICLLCLVLPPAKADAILWYNGDSRGRSTNATINFESTNLGSANIYDDFVVDRPWMEIGAQNGPTIGAQPVPPRLPCRRLAVTVCSSRNS
ncbi:hypothetical protein Fuma_02821 [Fuerstiella marisgermanici]|uniref:Uncharacterized protein n=1 Tax=Fuerstiella marisgermanici TaxID=1891926 RepID=A0A1P8WGN2_9PLAN|nr:hypothetical protein Fuma_02821 [Fuerstiella marisgermanici]